MRDHSSPSSDLDALLLSIFDMFHIAPRPLKDINTPRVTDKAPQEVKQGDIQECLDRNSSINRIATVTFEYTSSNTLYSTHINQEVALTVLKHFSRTGQQATESLNFVSCCCLKDVPFSLTYRKTEK